LDLGERRRGIISETRRQKKVLIADDEPINVTILKAFLSKAGYLVLTAENGADALEIAKAQTPDVIVLDIMMPGLDGTEVAAALKKNPRTRAIPVILLSSLVSNQEERSNVTKDFVSYLSKPVNAEKLLNEIKRCLMRREGSPLSE
jgi:CheY-like chemotaxis protein